MSKKKLTALWLLQGKAAKGGECMRCHQMVAVLTVDHIVPITFLDSFDVTGRAKYEDTDNFQFLCKPCNSVKANRYDHTNPKTKAIILKYLNVSGVDDTAAP